MQIISLFLCIILVFLPEMVLSQDQSFIEAQIKRWTEEVQKNPNDFETLAAIGAAYGKLGQHTTAIKYFQKAIAVNPSYAEAYFGLASAYGFLGRIDDEIRACKKGLELRPNDAIAYAKLGSHMGKRANIKSLSKH